METPLEYLFRDLPWSWFCTLTFDNDHNVKDQSKKWLWLSDWTKKVESICEIKRHSLPYIAASEVGERHGRFHFHLLVWIPDSNNVNLAYKAAHCWDCGIADIRRFDSRLGGASYVQKGWFAGANKFESKKLVSGLDSHGIISNAVWWLAGKSRGVEVPLELPDQSDEGRALARYDTLQHPYGKRLSGASFGLQRDPDSIG